MGNHQDKTRPRARPRPLGGAKWEPLQKEGLDPSAATVLSRQLAEMATYLLVWGEAWVAPSGDRERQKWFKALKTHEASVLAPSSDARSP